MNLVRMTFKGLYINFTCLTCETKTLFKSLIKKTAAKFKTIKNRHLGICCIGMNKCKTTQRGPGKPLPLCSSQCALALLFTFKCVPLFWV